MEYMAERNKYSCRHVPSYYFEQTGLDYISGKWNSWVNRNNKEFSRLNQSECHGMSCYFTEFTNCHKRANGFFCTCLYCSI